MTVFDSSVLLGFILFGVGMMIGVAMMMWAVNYIEKKVEGK